MFENYVPGSITASNRAIAGVCGHRLKGKFQRPDALGRADLATVIDTFAITGQQWFLRWVLGFINWPIMHIM